MHLLSRIIAIPPLQRQSLISFLWQIALMLIGFISTMYFTHTLGAATLGAYFLFLTYYSTIQMLTDAGLGGATIKRISEGNDQDKYLTTFFTLRLILITLSIIFLLIFQNSFQDLNTSNLFTPLIIILIISAFTGFISIGMTGTGKIGIRSTCNFIGEFTKTAIQIISVYLGFSAYGLVGGLLIGILITAIIEYRFLSLKFSRFGIHHIKSLSSFSFWLFLTNTGSTLYTSASTIIIGYYLTNADIGIYRVILQFSTVALLSSTAINFTIWPSISKWSKSNDYALIKQTISKTIDFSLILAIPILFGGILLGDKMLYYFYGSEFSAGYIILIILLFSQIITVFQSLFLNILSATDNQRIAFKVTTISSITNIILNLVLIPTIGIIGSAIATLTTMTINTLLSKYYLSKIVSTHIETTTIRNIISASLIMSAFILACRYFIPLTNVWLILPPIVMGGIIFMLAVLKFDNKLYIELRGIVNQTINR